MLTPVNIFLGIWFLKCKSEEYLLITKRIFSAGKEHQIILKMQNSPNSIFMKYSEVYSLTSLRPRQNVHRFSNDIPKRILLHENRCVLIKISLESHKGPANTKTA